jgi:thiamine biosynthesis lipoprotein
MRITVLGAALLWVVVFLLWMWRLGHPARAVFEKCTPSIMGTETTPKAVVERAGQAMRAAGARAGMVQCGGDLRTFGPSERITRWHIGVNDPFDPEGGLRPEVLLISDLAVSVSGNYRRCFTIQRRRLSHIVDPRSGRPVDAVPQVTVVAASAVVSEAWSTALSVLGPDGLKLLPSGVEAMLITESDHGPHVHKSPHFDSLLQR